MHRYSHSSDDFMTCPFCIYSRMIVCIHTYADIHIRKEIPEIAASPNGQGWRCSSLNAVDLGYTVDYWAQPHHEMVVKEWFRLWKQTTRHVTVVSAMRHRGAGVGYWCYSWHVGTLYFGLGIWLLETMSGKIFAYTQVISL